MRERIWLFRKRRACITKYIKIIKIKFYIYIFAIRINQLDLISPDWQSMWIKIFLYAFATFFSTHLQKSVAERFKIFFSFSLCFSINNSLITWNFIEICYYLCPIFARGIYCNKYSNGELNCAKINKFFSFRFFRSLYDIFSSSVINNSDGKFRIENWCSRCLSAYFATLISYINNTEVQETRLKNVQKCGGHSPATLRHLR